MTTARAKQICLEQTLWYHCTTRCVRRAFLCGFDASIKRNFDHRRQWIEDRLLFLAEAFCIDIGAFAILSNHYHVVLRVDQPLAQSLTDEQVVDRWSLLYPNNPVIKLLKSNEILTEEQQKMAMELISNWRNELANISRFMCLVNQYIARKSNIEDDCKGRFWECRFRCQAILDDQALLRTLAYVDLNPIRANMAKTPESSEHTSIRRRLKNNRSTETSKSGLLPFRPGKTALLEQEKLAITVPCSFKDYLSLLDWTGRQLKLGKRGRINPNTPPIFDRLDYSPEQWMKTQLPTIPWHQRALGSVNHIQAYCEALGRHWIWQAEDNAIRR